MKKIAACLMLLSLFSFAHGQETWVEHEGSDVSIVVVKAEVISSITTPLGTGEYALTTGQCLTTAQYVPGARDSMVVLATPVSPLSAQVAWTSYVSFPDWVTVSLCALANVVPGVSKFNIRVFQ